MNRDNRRVALVLAGIGCVVVAIFIASEALTEHSRHDWPLRLPIRCVNNLKQIGIAFRTWALDNGDRFPCNVPTNEGGTREVCVIGSKGLEGNVAANFQVMSNELSNVRILVCPKDKSRRAAANFQTLENSNISYRLYSGPGISEAAETNVLVSCPVCGNVLMCDGSVRVVEEDRPSRFSVFLESLKSDQKAIASLTGASLLALLGVVLVRVGLRAR